MGGHASIAPAQVRWHASSFRFPNERRTTANEGDTVNLYLELVDVTPEWLADRAGRSVGITLSQVGGNATLSDYSFPYRVWIPTDKLAVAVAVPITQDELVEGDESASVCFEPGGNQNITYYTTRRCAQIDIGDDDTAIVSVTGGTIGRTVAEGETLELELTLDKKVERSVKVDLGTSNGTTSDDDYTLAPRSITFSPSAAETFKRTIRLETTDDSVVERDESLKLQLSLGSNMEAFRGVLLLEGRTVGVRITDDDTALLTLESSPEPVPEGSNVTLTARLSNPIQRSFTVNWWVQAATRRKSGFATYSDLQDIGLLTTASLRFASKQTAATFTIRTAQDALVEGDETFLVYLQEEGTVHGLDRGTVRSAGHKVTIGDDDAPVISVVPSEVTVAEGGAATLAVRLAAAANTDVQVKWSTADDTATAGTDYTAQAATTLTFTPGQTEKTITAQTTDDDLVEGNETFNVQLATVDSLTTLATSTVPVTIQDDDGSESVEWSVSWHRRRRCRREARPASR